MANPFGQPPTFGNIFNQPPTFGNMFGQPTFGQPEPPRQPTYDQFTTKFDTSSWGFTPQVSEPSIAEILDRLRREHPTFALYLKRFRKPYFIFGNEVTFQTKKYTVYGRKIYDDLELGKPFTVELKDFQVADVTMEKASF